jgi:hypothetical protein
MLFEKPFRDLEPDDVQSFLEGSQAKACSGRPRERIRYES